MSAPWWLRVILSAAMLAVICFHLRRLVSVRAKRRFADRAGAALPDVDLGHAAMGVAMVAMLIGPMSGPGAREVALVFFAATAWFVGRGLYHYVAQGGPGTGRLLVPALGCAAMAYMLERPGGVGAFAGMTGPTPDPLSGPAMSAMSTMPAMSSGDQSLLLAAVTSSVVGAFLIAGTVVAAISGIALIAGRSLSLPRPPVRVLDSSASVIGLGCGLAVNVTTVYMLIAG
jgi:hypothetical protein